ncbi:NtaA/DmoA family FMN-dependent monooxygenase [Gluconacetobacter sp. Hr-1-5]|uniref:NtaA/DmoA family FMN-dependent monooxygenase n=1 Tax=Gluconacetobacter sp. Hr-1-5 TaxID=3395370 RepID=UPI003B52DAFF
MARDGKLRLGIGLQGGGGHWRDPDIGPAEAVSIESYQRAARIGEDALFDFGFIADSPYITRDSTWHFLSRLEPLAALSAISARTSRLGLVGTFSTSYSYPFTTARQVLTLDHISHGRAGWNAVTSALEGMARNFGGERLHDHALRYRIAREYIEVVQNLWDSFEPDAFVRNRETGQYVDWDKMHTLDHKGEFFSVEGPLNLERSPQGRPVIFQAGASDAGRDLAARHADAVFSTFAESDDLTACQEHYRDLKTRAVAHGRHPDDILVFPSIRPIVAETEEEAEAKYQRELSFIDPDHAVKYLARYFSFFDFGQFPLDEPLPDLGDIGANSFKSTAEYYLRLAREEGLTLRQLAYQAAAPRGIYVGTPQTVADRIQHAFEQQTADGFILFGTHAHLRDFTRLVVPILQQRGLFRTAYESTTLRGNLGLATPRNRYAVS